MSIECYEHSCPFHDKQEPYCYEDHCIKCCPSCGEENYIPNRVRYNIENYGSAVVNFHCLACNKIIEAQLKRRVTVTTVGSKVSDKKIDDWGEP